MSVKASAVSEKIILVCLQRVTKGLERGATAALPFPRVEMGFMSCSVELGGNGFSVPVCDDQVSKKPARSHLHSADCQLSTSAILRAIQGMSIFSAIAG